MRHLTELLDNPNTHIHLSLVDDVEIVTFVTWGHKAESVSMTESSAMILVNAFFVINADKL